MQVAVKLRDHVSCVYLLPLGRLSEHLDFIITFSISISHLYHPLHLSSRNFENFRHSSKFLTLFASMSSSDLDETTTSSRSRRR